MKQDMTKGNPFKIILLFAIPILLGNTFQNLYNIVDSIIVGRLLGTNALAAVGTTGPVNFLIMGFIFGLTSGYAVVTAQAFGSKDEELLKRSVAMNIMLNSISAVIFTVVALLTARPIFKAINTPPEVIDLTIAYISVIYSGITTALLYNTCSCILRAVGDSKTPLYFLIFSSCLNIILDYSLIKFAGLGVAGAAYATVFSQAVSGILCVIVISKKYKELHVERRHFKWDWKFAWRHLRIGLPMALQNSVTAIGVTILQGALNKFGPAVIAGQTAGAKVEQFITVAGMSFGIVMANYAGQNFGAKRMDRVRKGTLAGTVLTLGFSFIATAIVLCFPTQLTGFFLDSNSAFNKEVLAASRLYLSITGSFYSVLFLIFIYRNVLQAIGHTFMPLMCGFFELIARTVCAFTLPRWLGFKGICFAGPAAFFSACIPLMITYFVVIRRMKKQLK